MRLTANNYNNLVLRIAFAWDVILWNYTGDGARDCKRSSQSEDFLKHWISLKEDARPIARKTSDGWLFEDD